jgi:hypothetical protein
MNMLLIASLLLAGAEPAQTSVYTGDLAKCLVAKTSDNDRLTLVKWIFAAISASPKVADMTHVDDAGRETHNRQVAALFNRLIAVDCRAEAVAGIRYEGQPALEGAFGTLGQVAMRDLMNEDRVSASVAQMGELAQTPELHAVLKEAGIKTPPAQAKE